MKTHYVISVRGENGVVTPFHIQTERHAEAILRGLVHSGYTVTITEVKGDEKGTSLETPNFRFVGDDD